MISTIIRTAVIYICVIVAIRLMGKRQISDMQPSELVITILISEIAAIPLQDSTKPVLTGVLAIFVLVVLEICLSVLSMKSTAIRRALSGRSIVIISDGKINQSEMRRVRMTVPDLMEQLRSKDVFDISRIAYAILEVNGELNVMLKEEFSPAEKQDVTQSIAATSLPLAVICDGKLIDDAINAVGSTKERIISLLRGMSYRQEDIFLMTLDTRGNNTVVLKEG